MTHSQLRKLKDMPPGVRAEELRVSMIRASAALHFIQQQRKQLDTQENNVEQSMRNLAQLAREDGMPRRRIAKALNVSISYLGLLMDWDVEDLLEEQRVIAEQTRERDHARRAAAHA